MNLTNRKKSFRLGGIAPIARAVPPFVHTNMDELRLFYNLETFLRYTFYYFIGKGSARIG